MSLLAFCDAYYCMYIGGGETWWGILFKISTHYLCYDVTGSCIFRLHDLNMEDFLLYKWLAIEHNVKVS